MESIGITNSQDNIINITILFFFLICVSEKGINLAIKSSFMALVSNLSTIRPKKDGNLFTRILFGLRKLLAKCSHNIELEEIMKNSCNYRLNFTFSFWSMTQVISTSNSSITCFE